MEEINQEIEQTNTDKETIYIEDINAYNQIERRRKYLEGGIFSIKTRVQIFDQQSRIQMIEQVTGLLILNGDKIYDTGQESFCIQLLTENKNILQFIQVFSQNPQAQIRTSNRLIDILKQLNIKKVYLWPRFYKIINKDLQLCEPKVIEIKNKPSNIVKKMLDICMDQLGALIKKYIKTDEINDSDDDDGIQKRVNNLCIENILSPTFIILYKQILLKFSQGIDSIHINQSTWWYGIQKRQRYWEEQKKATEYIQDIQLQRMTLYKITELDCISFLQYLEAICYDTNIVLKSSWQRTKHALELYKLAKSRVYIFHNWENYNEPMKLSDSIELVLEEDPSFIELCKILNVIIDDIEHTTKDGCIYNINNIYTIVITFYSYDKLLSFIPYIQQWINSKKFNNNKKKNFYNNKLLLLQTQKRYLYSRDDISTSSKERAEEIQKQCDISANTSKVYLKRIRRKHNDNNSNVLKSTQTKDTLYWEHMELVCQREQRQYLDTDDVTVVDNSTNDIFVNVDTNSSVGLNITNDIIDLHDNATDSTVGSNSDITNSTVGSNSDTTNNTVDPNSDTTNNTVGPNSDTTNNTVGPNSDTTNSTVGPNSDTTNNTVYLHNGTTDSIVDLNNNTNSDTTNNTVYLHNDTTDSIVDLNNNTNSDTTNNTTNLHSNNIYEIYATQYYRYTIDIGIAKIEILMIQENNNIDRQQKKKYSNEKIQPQYYILCSPSLLTLRKQEQQNRESAFIRLQEHKKICKVCNTIDDIRIKLFLLILENSQEQQLLQCSIAEETQSFEKLIDLKATMVISKDRDEYINTMPRYHLRDFLKKNINEYLDKDNEKNITEETLVHELGIIDSTEELFYKSNTTTNISNNNNTNILTKIDNKTKEKLLEQKRTREKDNLLVLVDQRELRSTLPYKLYMYGFQLYPVTLETGDYVLTPTIAIERKSIPDLISSQQSGRLISQIRYLKRYYDTPIVLIEFDERKPFHLQLSNDILTFSYRTLLSKLCAIILQFPTTRILWSKNYECTALFFLEFKLNKLQPKLPDIAFLLQKKTWTPNQLTMLNTIDKLPKNYLKIRNSRKQLALDEKINNDTIGQDNELYLEKYVLNNDKDAIIDELEIDKTNTDSYTPIDLLSCIPFLQQSHINILSNTFETLLDICQSDLNRLNTVLGTDLGFEQYSFLHRDGIS